MNEFIGVDIRAMAKNVTADRIGDAIPLMVSRMAAWREQGRRVVIVTPWGKNASHALMIFNWCRVVFGRDDHGVYYPAYAVTGQVDEDMLEFWGPRNVRVEHNAGTIDNDYQDGTLR